MQATGCDSNVAGPVLLAGKDADDELWQLLGTPDAGGTGKIGHLHHAVDEDPG